MEDDGQVLLCVEISDLLAATEVSLTLSLEGVNSNKAGMMEEVFSVLCVMCLTKIGPKKVMTGSECIICDTEVYEIIHGVVFRYRDQMAAVSIARVILTILYCLCYC